MSRIRIPAAAVLLAAAVASLHASSPKFFQAATQTEFLKGEVENLSVDDRGELALGPATDLVYETPAPFLWGVIPGADGLLFVGSGNQGRVFRIDAQGKGAPFFAAAELEVHALAAAPNGGLYVGTSPNGKIYKVDRSGSSTVLFDPGEKYIWALATDSRGALYAATGEKGVVYKITPDGKGAPFYQSKATHVTALAVDKGGNLLVGTEAPGRVLRVDPEGKAFLLLDSPFEEISALRFDERGVLYVAAVSGHPSAGAAPAPPSETGTPSAADPSRASVVVVTTEVTSVGVADGSGSAAQSGSIREDRSSPKGAVYRIAADGLWDEVWRSTTDSPYDLAQDAQGRLVIGTGNKGKVYRLEGDPPQPALMARASAQQVTSLYRDAKGQLYYTTANPGKIYRLSSGLAAQGSYESEPRDAQIVSTWGSLSWQGSFPPGTRVEVSSRSGNTETPDDTWSSWSPPYTAADGSPIVSPKARFLQWRAILIGARGQSPVLTSVKAAYLQRNLRPVVHSITVHPPGIVFQKPFSTGEPDLAGFDNQTTPDRKLTNAAMTSQSGSASSASLGRKTYQKGLQTLVWRADDENEDELIYEIQYRREGDATWKVLRRDLSEPILVWDTTTVPNGTYFVKVIASDAPANSSETALAGELVSSAFEVDNAPPVIAIHGIRTAGARTIISFGVSDDHSPIQRVEYLEDGQEWRGVFPKDGIADSKREEYEITIDGPIPTAGLSIRATDTMNNFSTTQVDATRR